MNRVMFLSLLAACGQDGPTPTFHQDVAPILDAQCMSCHQTGGIGPMSFETYDEVKEWSTAIVAATSSRTMPPKQVVGDGTCGDFVDPGWLTDAELEVLSRWADEGTPKGAEAARNFPEPPALVGNAISLKTPEFYPEPVGGQLAENDEYRCFLMDLDLTTDKFLTGYQVVPGNEAIVHHVIGNVVDPNAQGWGGQRTNADIMAALDAESPDREGWPCFSGAGDEVSVANDAVAWAPGQGVVEFPGPIGFRVPAGSVFVAQIHYNLVDPATQGQSDSSEVRLVLEDSVQKEAYPFYIDFLLGTGDRLPAGRKSYEYRQSIQVQDLSGVPLGLELWGVLPHMHERGRTLNATLRRGDGTDECLVQVDNWDFGWQYAYFYDTPIPLAPNDVWDLACTFDTSDDAEDILAGWGTQNEMCLTTVYVTVDL